MLRAKHEYPPMSPETRGELMSFFRPYNKKLYEYLGRNFGWDDSK